MEREIFYWINRIGSLIVIAALSLIGIYYGWRLTFLLFFLLMGNAMEKYKHKP